MMIRKYQPSDLEPLRQITAICFEDVSIDKNIEDKFGVIAGVDWKQRKMPHIDDDVEANPGGIFVAEIDREIVGYITTRVNHRTKIAGIPNLSVHPKFQRRGLGKQLIETALAYLTAEGMLYARIETLVQNEIGTDFYPKMGFVEVARQIHYIRPL
jgi:ribosomal protein S18 acetylase RimI-like enzyme